MTEEEKQQLAKAGELAEQVKVLTQNLTNVVEEVKTQREKIQAKDAEIEVLKTKVKPDAKVESPEDVEAIVRRVNGERDEKTASENKTSAEQKFLARHKEFSADNDPGGIKLAAWKAKLGRFKQQGLVKEEDFISVFEEAYVLVIPPQERTIVAPYSSESPLSPNAPESKVKSELSDRERKLLTVLGPTWNEERLLKVKTSRGAGFVEQLMTHSNI